MIGKIVDKKEKHSWSVQIMDELLSRTPSHGYNRNGRNPKLSQCCTEDEETISVPENNIPTVSDSTIINEIQGCCSTTYPQTLRIPSKDTSSPENTNFENGQGMLSLSLIIKYLKILSKYYTNIFILL